TISPTLYVKPFPDPSRSLVGANRCRETTRPVRVLVIRADHLGDQIARAPPDPVHVGHVVEVKPLRPDDAKTDSCLTHCVRVASKKRRKGSNGATRVVVLGSGQ